MGECNFSLKKQTIMQRRYLIPLAIVGLFFFSIGFALGINSFLMPVLKSSMHMSPVAANLLIAATFAPFIFFGIPAGKCIEAIGYKRTMAVSFGLFIVAFALFIVAASQESIAWFLIASFVSGAANTVLQACVNPYVTILGPIESAASRISIMGICNKLAWPCTTLFITYVIGKTTDECQIADLYTSFLLIIGIFFVLGVIALLAPMPEVKAAGEDEDEKETPVCAYAEGKTSILQFPHLLLGALTQFLYVGVETISLVTAQDYAVSLHLTGDWYGYIPSFGMIAGYLVGVFCIPRLLSQAMALRLCSVTAIVGSVCVATLPGDISIWFIFLMALGCSLMSPALWPLAMTDLGKFTKRGASLLTMAIAGGAVMPLVRSWLETITDYQTSYWICLPCFLFILYYGVAGYKIRKG